MDLFFESVFLKERAKDFRRIAGKTKGEVTVEDLQSEAWIIAYNIGIKRGELIDFTDPIDQETILGKLYVNHVLRADKQLKFAARIGREYEGDDGSTSIWGDQLAASETSDPLALIILREEKDRDERAILSTYSQFAAYVIVLYNFNDDRLELCAFLLITPPTLRKRMQFAEDTVRVQPSLFDCIERIDECFMPQCGRQYVVKTEHQHSTDQLAWVF